MVPSYNHANDTYGVKMMNLPNIFSDRRFKGMAVAVAIVFLVLIILNIFIVGGDMFIYTVNSSINFPLAILVTISAFGVWRRMGEEKHNRSLWLGLVIGWGLWALAETIWAGYSIVGSEVPYPSWADFFWGLGYIPIGIGLVARIRTMPARPNRSQNLLIIGASAITILITILFIFVPTVQSFDIHRLIESVLNFYYPLSDVFLLVIIWRLFFTFEEGDFGFGWRFLTFGFIFLIVSDLLFTYTTWQGLYYPDMQANPISRLDDVTYTVSYLIWFLGIYAMRILLKKEYHSKLASRIRVVRTYGHILVYTKGDDSVINISSNFDRFFENANVIGKSLAQALTISEQNGQAILDTLRKDGRVADLPLQICNRSGVLQDVRLSGLAVYDSEKNYMGANLLLRMRVADGSFDRDLSPESRLLPIHLLQQSGSSSDGEIGQFLSDYYLSYIRSLLEMAVSQGGPVMAQALLDQLSETARKHNWLMRFNAQTVLENTNYPLAILRQALPELLETARQFVSKIMDPVVVEAHLRELGSQIDESIHRDAVRYLHFDREAELSDHHKGSLGA